MGVPEASILRCEASGLRETMTLKWTVGVTKSTWGATCGGMWYDSQADYSVLDVLTLQDIILLTDVLFATCMLIDMIFGPEKLLGFLHRCVQFDPSLEFGDTYPFSSKAVI